MKQEFLYSVEREYGVSMEAMWQAWTNAEELEKWYHPTVLSVVPGSTTSQARVGGIWSVAVDVPDYGFVAYFWGQYKDVQEGARLEHSMIYSQDQAEFVLKDMSKPSHRIVIDFEERDGGVWVRFSQYGEMPAEQIEATQAGMESYFDSLAEYLA
jgi:uncharacterized protein YndB with AHSA1/START domain